MLEYKKDGELPFPPITIVEVRFIDAAEDVRYKERIPTVPSNRRPAPRINKADGIPDIHLKVLAECKNMSQVRCGWSWQATTEEDIREMKGDTCSNTTNR